jgi:hypothetical protein
LTNEPITRWLLISRPIQVFGGRAEWVLRYLRSTESPI